MRRCVALLGCAAAGLMAPLLGAPTSVALVATDSTSAQLSLVLLRGDSVAAALPPAPGHRLHARSTAARSARESVLDEQALVRAGAGVDDVTYSYTTALNGFAAKLTAAQVSALEDDPDVLSVQPSTTLHLDASAERRVVGDGGNLTLASAASAWRELGGPARAGHGIVIGVVDSGIWPENPSFAGVPLDTTQVRHQFPRFRGTCQPGQQWDSSLCNDKIVGARYFVAGFGATRVSAAEYLSARDASGHGSHVAAIAAGNAGVAVTIAGQRYGHVSGVAPDAGIAVYKACWTAPNPAADGCTTADTVAAIDSAVSDGVDVLNLSISGSDGGPDDAVERALLGAATAGVFTSTSAGDGGPAPATVAHPSPWVTTVAASTQHTYQGGVRLGDGRVLVGSMVSDRHVADAPIVLGRQVASPRSTPHRAALCEADSLDAAAVDGTIVVCRRGDVARVEKSAAVAQAGGRGMVLVNTAPGDTDADVHAVPTVHLDVAAGRLLVDYLHRARHPHGSLDPTAARPTAQPALAGFSGRGPSAEADVLKPDLSAPGVSVVSAVAPGPDSGRLWDLASGTSMSAPQVAGAAALIRTAHPAWSTAEVKSALMTTAGPFADGSGPLGHGAGDLRVDRALRPGLVYDAGPTDWNRYLDGEIDPSNLNQASIAIDNLVGPQKVTRRVTNVAGHPSTYTASVGGLRGVAVRVTPPTLRLRPGETARFRVTFTAGRNAAYPNLVSGSLRWTSPTATVVNSPIVIRPETFAAPPELTAPAAARTTVISGPAGVTGTLRASVVGAATTRPSRLQLVPGAFDRRHPQTVPTTYAQQYAVTGQVSVARFDLAALADVDLYVYRNGHLIDSAASPSDSESITLEHPRPGVYDVYAVAPAPDPSQPPASVSATYSAWFVHPGAAAGVRFVHNRVRGTGSEPVRWLLRWTPRPPGERTLAEIRYRGTTGRSYLTIG